MDKVQSFFQKSGKQATRSLLRRDMRAAAVATLELRTIHMWAADIPVGCVALTPVAKAVMSWQSSAGVPAFVPDW